MEEDWLQRAETIETTQVLNDTNNQKEEKWEEKQLYVLSTGQKSEISHEKNWTWLRNRDLKRETDSPNNSTKTML